MHASAAEGYQRQAEVYQRARPTYHPAQVRRVVQHVGDGRVVELGAGTGIFTAQLIEAGADVIAIEPVPAMRSTLEARLPQVDALSGTAEAIPLPDSSAAAVVAAQSFHWFDAVAALHEIARVCRPGGHLLTVWNVRDESVPWVARYTEVMDRYVGDTPRHRTFEWRAALDGDHRFTLVDQWAVYNPHPTDQQGVVDRALSTSFIAALDDDEHQRVAAEIAAIVAPLGPDFDYPYRSELQAWRLR